MEDEGGWKGFEKHLLGRITRARLADLHGLALRKVCKRVLNGAYGIGLREWLRGQS